MELAGLVVGIIGIVIALATYKKQFYEPPKVFAEPEPVSAKENLLVYFKVTQRLSLDVQDLIQQYVDQGYGDELIFTNVSFNNYLNLQKVEFDKCLSDKLYFEIKSLTLTKDNIDSMLASITEQSKALQQIKVQMQLLINNSKYSLQ